MSFDAGSITATLTLSRDQFIAALEDSKRKVREFADERYEVTLGLNRQLTSGLAIARQQLDEFARNSYDVRVRVDTGDDSTRIAELSEQLDRAARDRVARIVVEDVGNDRTTSSSQKEFGSNADFAQRALNALVISAVAAAPALVPVTGALIGVAGALSAVGTAATLGIGGLAIVAKENSAAITSQLGVVKQAAAQLGEQFGPQLLAISGPALQSVAGLVRDLAPATDAAVGAVGKLAAQFEASANGGGLSKFITDMTQLTGPSITGLGRILTDSAAGVGHFVEAFAPLSTTVLAGIARSTAAFSKFNFGPLVAYAAQSLPSLGRLFSDLGNIVLGVSKTVAPLGTSVLDVVHGLAQGIQGTLPGLQQFAANVAAPSIRTFGPVLHAAGDAIGEVAGALSHLGGFLSPAIVEILAVTAAFKGVSLAVSGVRAVSGAFDSVVLGVRKAQQAMAELSYSASASKAAIGQIGSAALSGGALAAVGVVAAGAAVGIGLLIKHYEDGKPKIDSFTAALQASNGQINAGVRAQAAQSLSQNGILAIADKLNIALPTVTDASLGVASAQKQIAAQSGAAKAALQTYTNALDKQVDAGKPATAAELAHRTALQQTASAYDRLTGYYTASDGTLRAQVKSQQDITAATASSAVATQQMGTAQQLANAAAGALAPIQERLTTDTLAYKAAMSGLDTELTAIVAHFQGVQGAEDALATDINSLTASVKTNGKTFEGSSAAALANRSAIRQYGTDYAALVEAISKSNEPIAVQNQQLTAQRAALLASAAAAGLPKSALEALGTELQALKNHDPNLTIGVKIAGDKLAIGRITDVYNSVKKVPSTANTAFVAQGVKNRLTDAGNMLTAYKKIPSLVNTAASTSGVSTTLTALKSVTTGAGKVPTSIVVDVSSDAAAITEQLQQLTYAGQQAKNELELKQTSGSGGSGKPIPAFGKGGPVTGPGGPEDDQVMAYLSAGEFVVRAKQVAKYRGLLNGINNDNIPKLHTALTGAGLGAQAAAANVQGSLSSSFQSLLRYAQQNLPAALTGGTTAQMKTALNDLADKVGSAFTSLGKQESTAEAQVTSYTGRLRVLNDELGKLDPKSRDYAASRQTILDEIDSENSKLAKVTLTLQGLQRIKPGTENALLGLLGKDNSRLKVLAADRDLTVSRLTAAQTNLSNLQKTSASYASSLTSNLLGSAGLFSNGEGPITARDAISGLSLNLSQLLAFQKALGQLKARGFSAAIIDQVAQAGVAEGLPAAQALLQSSASQVSQIDRLQGQITSTSTNIGTATAQSLYGAGIKAAQGLVDGLQSQQAAINKQMNQIADNLAKAIERAVGDGVGAATKDGSLSHVSRLGHDGRPPVRPTHTAPVTVEVHVHNTIDGQQFDGRMVKTAVKAIAEHVVSSQRHKVRA